MQVPVDVLDDSDVAARPVDNALEIVFDVAAVLLASLRISIPMPVSILWTSPQRSIPMPLSVLWSLPERSMTRNSWSR